MGSEVEGGIVCVACGHNLDFRWEVSVGQGLEDFDVDVFALGNFDVDVVNGAGNDLRSEVDDLKVVEMMTACFFFNS